MNLLDELLTAWRQAPNAELADRIEKWGPWPELEAPLTGKSAKLRERMEALRALDADPRIDRFVARLYASPPVKAATSYPFWEEVRQLARRMRDVRAFESLRATHHAARSDDAWHRHLRAQLDLLFLELGEVTDMPLSPELDARLAELDAAMTTTGDEPWVQVQRAFLADPRNEALRRVVLDALLEVDHPRARLALLQREGHDVHDFVTANADALLGPLAKVLKPGGAFAQGWLCKCELKESGNSALERLRDEAAGHLFWATVEELTGPGDARISAHPVMKSLRTLRRSELTVDALADLRLERLLDYPLRREDALRFADANLLPGLSELQVRVMADDVELLLPRAGALRSFRVDLLDVTPRSAPHLVQRLAALRLDESALGFFPDARGQSRLVLRLRCEDGWFEPHVSSNSEDATNEERLRLEDEAGFLRQLVHRLGLTLG